MNVYWRELRANLRSVILWCVGIFLFVAASMGKYSAMAGTGQSGADLMAGLPTALQAIFGVGSLDFTKALGFFGMIFPYLLLMAAIHASMLGAGILSKEERDRTSEFLYVKPVTRSQIITAKLLAALSYVVVLNLVTWAGSLALVRHFAVAGEPVSIGIARLMAGMFFVQILFLSIGIAAAAVLRQPRASTGVATGVMLATYVLSVAIDVNGRINWVKGFTPFEYFDAKLIVGSEKSGETGTGLNEWYVALCVGLAVALTVSAYASFRRRDLRV